MTALARDGVSSVVGGVGIVRVCVDGQQCVAEH
jgi:hypothetical protein